MSPTPTTGESRSSNFSGVAKVRRLGLILLLILWAPAWAGQDVANTAHNLSVSGPGTFKSLTVSQICVFCHTPHNANPSIPLWNHQLPQGQTYIEYGSSTLQAQPGQPTGTSRLCLSCHDGTVALGGLSNPPSGGVNDLSSTFLTGRAGLGTDLADDHPISFAYDVALQAKRPQLAHPASIDLPLENGRLECGSCHDPHEKDIVPFLRKTSLNGQICVTCHALGDASWNWSVSTHATSGRTPVGKNPWSERKPEWRGTTVAENACFNCHRPHAAGVPARLMKDQEEATCFRCHDGSGAQKNIRAEILTKTSAHGVDIQFGQHDPAENFAVDNPPNHVECSDCHNPHATVNTPATAPNVRGSMAGVTGITSSGAQVQEASQEYEVCYKCHGNNNVIATPTVPRLIDDVNTRLEFDTANPSYHPVEGPGQNANVPSLIQPLTAGSVIYCTDCHNNDDIGAGGAGSAPRGPHGSRFRPLLQRNYSVADRAPENPSSYALCYKCHNRTSILNDDSFKEHDKHIRGENAPCSACHDAHGISSARGNSLNNSNLMNFDRTIVFANQFAEPEFNDTGLFRGSCDLLCHNERHDNETYQK